MKKKIIIAITVIIVFFLIGITIWLVELNHKEYVGSEVTRTVDERVEFDKIVADTSAAAKEKYIADMLAAYDVVITENTIDDVAAVEDKEILNSVINSLNDELAILDSEKAIIGEENFEEYQNKINGLIEAYTNRIAEIEEAERKAEEAANSNNNSNNNGGNNSNGGGSGGSNNSSSNPPDLDTDPAGYAWWLMKKLGITNHNCSWGIDPVAGFYLTDTDTLTFYDKDGNITYHF